MIEIKINKRTGDITTEAHGYTGNDCSSALDAIEKLLGLYSVNVEDKTEDVVVAEMIQARR